MNIQWILSMDNQQNECNLTQKFAKFFVVVVVVKKVRVAN